MGKRRGGKEMDWGIAWQNMRKDSSEAPGSGDEEEGEVVWVLLEADSLFP